MSFTVLVTTSLNKIYLLIEYLNQWFEKWNFFRYHDRLHLYKKYQMVSHKWNMHESFFVRNLIHVLNTFRKLALHKMK